MKRVRTFSGQGVRHGGAFLRGGGCELGRARGRAVVGRLKPEGVVEPELGAGVEGPQGARGRGLESDADEGPTQGAHRRTPGRRGRGTRRRRRGGGGGGGRGKRGKRGRRGRRGRRRVRWQPCLLLFFPSMGRVVVPPSSCADSGRKREPRAPLLAHFTKEAVCAALGNEHRRRLSGLVSGRVT